MFNPGVVNRSLSTSLLDQFWFHGPNGYHQCLVGEPAGGSNAKSKEDSTNFMFPLDAARSIAAQLLLGLSYLHANGICHGGEDNYVVYLGLLIRILILGRSPFA